MSVIIRDARELDFPALIGLFQEFAAFEKFPERMTNSVEKMIAEKDLFTCFVAENENKEITGYATCFFCYYTWSGKSLYMDDLYVKPEFRGNGIGSQLIYKIIAFAKNSHCHKLRWQVSKWNNPAIDFYKKLGAIIEDTEQNCDLIFD